MPTSQPPGGRRGPRWAAWLGFVALCNGAGYLSARASVGSALYAQLVRPSWSPPGWLFGPVWGTLYVLMGTATYLVWSQTRGGARRAALRVFGAQLALNVLWTPVFFGMRRYGLAVVVIAAVLASVTAMIVVYRRHVRLAAVLLVPLWLWVAFASALNVAIWWLNRG